MTVPNVIKKVRELRNNLPTNKTTSSIYNSSKNVASIDRETYLAKPTLNVNKAKKRLTDSKLVSTPFHETITY